MPGAPSVAAAVGLALFAAFLWATSFIYVKEGLEDLPPLTFAALRYVIGALALMSYRLVRNGSARNPVPSSMWTWLTGLGLLLYAVVPALMFLGLDRVEAVSFNFIFQAGIPLILAFTAGAILREPTSPWEWAGVLIVVAGIYVFFPAIPEGSEAAGLLLAAGAAAGIGGSNLIQRNMMRTGSIASLDAAMIPMAIGSVALLVVALIVEPFPELGSRSIVLLLLLGVVNTAFAFTIWHRAMRTLKALHAGVIATTQLVEVAVLAWIFLGESLTASRIVGSAIVIAGILVVHLSKARAAKAAAVPVEVSA